MARVITRAAARAAGLAAALASCGYAFTAGVSRLPAGAEVVAVPPLSNRTADAEAGALVAAALRRELARRGADGGSAAPARIEGEIEEVSVAPSSVGAATWRLTLVLRAHLEVGERRLPEERVRRNQDYAGGVDALESEGRRRIALQRAAEAAARELLERLEGR